MRNRLEGFRWLAILAVLLGVALLVCTLIAIRQADDQKYAETRGTMTEGFGELPTVTVDGVAYQQKPAVTTLLIAGIDQTEDRVQGGLSASVYRRGGQADFLLLLAIDHTDKKIHQLAIDRDTMTDVAILGIFGNETGTRVRQICLAHYFGATPADNAHYTVRAVEKLLGGYEIEGYYMADYSAVPALNDLLGGVTVTVEDNMTDVSPDWTPGTVLTLHGQQAEAFVRARMTVGDGTNEARMKRQNSFISGLLSQVRRRMGESLSFADTLFGGMAGKAETNLTTTRLINEMNRAWRYEVLPADTLPGEHRIGEDGFMEFHAEEGSAVQWVLSHLYQKKSEE